MALLKVRDRARITLPAEIRKVLNVSAGDYLEARIVEGGVLLKPASAPRDEKAWDELLDIVDTPKRREPTALSPDEEEEWIAEQIEAFRREQAAGRS